jgi:enamine deaminase RidA (YjgF/YER057c/UK114 family)
LNAVGSSLALVVKSTVYVVAERREDLAEVWEVVRASELAQGPHASTLVGVSLLGYPDQLVEIEAVAVCAELDSAEPGDR